ncbi:hypothetical protein ABGB18_28240 [Nonomuraea sp. B12E4]|uniref:hypothetical protein n=1 Tax=Nonomuraea sp. B12E4 TaxID=3153564 RepID=UPI00325EBA1D
MNRWLAWADRLAARPRRRPVRRPAAPLVLLRPRRPMSSGGSSLVVSMVIGLRGGPARMTVVRLPGPSRGLRWAAPVVGRTRVATVLDLRRTVRERNAGEARRDRDTMLIRRDGTRTTMLIHGDGTRVTAPLRRGHTPSAAHARVELPVREWRGTSGLAPRPPVPAGPVVTRVPARQAVPGAGWRAAEPQRGAEARVTEARPPALDLDRIADDVVRRIDRRIVAHRERLGRI